MKRIFVILIGLIVTAVFAVYILELTPNSSAVAPDYEEDATGETENVQTVLNKTVQRQREAVPQAMESLVDATTSSLANADKPDWKLVWSDEFDAEGLNMEYWSEVTRKNNYNNELQYYTADNSYIENGHLVLKADKEERDGKKYTSAMVQTKDKLTVAHGRIEACVRLPVGKGIFPAFWMLPYSGKTEIDILEMIGSEPNIIYGVNHYNLDTIPAKTYGQIVIDSPMKFHVYAVEWDKQCLKWYVDDKCYHTTTIGIPDEEMYLIFSLAVGGVWPGEPDINTVFPAVMEVDYVRVYAAASP